MIEVGQVFETNKCGDCVVVAYHNYKHIEVLFPETGYVAKCESGSLRRGEVKDPFCPVVYGQGFLGVGNHLASIDSKPTRLYKLWSHMLERCYSAKYHERKPTYIGCKVVDRWRNFQLFCADLPTLDGYTEWLDQDNGFQLDKDIKIEGNRIYGPATCMFVSAADNSSDGQLRRRSNKNKDE